MVKHLKYLLIRKPITHELDKEELKLINDHMTILMLDPRALKLIIPLVVSLT